MGAFLDKPKTDKHTEGGVGNGLKYGISSMQGWRIEMEDAHSAVIGMPYGLNTWSFFAVFDGHAGARVSALCASGLLDHIVANKDFHGKLEVSQGTEITPSIDDVRRGIKTGFLALDSEMRTMPEIASGVDKSGSTAVTAIINSTHIFFGNCGDSRAVLCRSTECVFSTIDHKPVNQAEKERIQNAGGSVMIQRVNGSLAVSRALGDFEYKTQLDRDPCEQLVSPEPEISVVARSEHDEFLVLACDGIWDVMTNQEICEFVRSRMLITNKLEDICNMVIDTCLYKGSKDNMSIVIVAFKGSPEVNGEAIKRDLDFNVMLAEKTKTLIDNLDPEKVEVSYVVPELEEMNLPGVPPGGGLMSKRSIIEGVLVDWHKSRDSDSGLDGDLD